MKTILVTFDLTGATYEQYRAAYRLLGSLGLHVVAQNVQLPSTSVIGDWYAEASAVEIRNLLVQMLSTEVPLESLAVAVVAEAAWWRKTS